MLVTNWKVFGTIDLYKPRYLDVSSNVVRSWNNVQNVQVLWYAFDSFDCFAPRRVFSSSSSFIPSIIPGRVQVMSTYPARISSGDDFYFTSAKLGIQETTIGIGSDSVLWLGVYNNDLKKYITPQVVMQWARNMIANRLAKYMNLALLDGLVRERNGRISTSATILVSSFLFIHWIGTYNNEWMVIDYKLIQDVSVFTKNDKNEYQFLPGTFTLLEQIPGSTHEEDLTEYIFRRRASLRLVFWTKKDSSPLIIFLTLRISTILLATLNVLPNIYLLSWWMTREFPLFQSTATIILMRKHHVLKSLLETLLTFKTTKIWDSWWCTTITLMMSSPSATALLAILPLWQLPAEAIWMIPMVFLLLWSWWF